KPQKQSDGAPYGQLTYVVAKCQPKRKVAKLQLRPRPGQAGADRIRQELRAWIISTIQQENVEKKFYAGPSLWIQNLATQLEREILRNKPNIHWNDIAGLQDAKNLLVEAVVLPRLVPDSSWASGARGRACCWWDPRAQEKTMLAEAVATECDTTFFPHQPC
ncbi:hypothetical protein BaRGS_00027027, partial [Batillaria attramentaria]